MDETTMLFYNEYYRNTEILFELIKQLKGKEFILFDGKTAIRGLKAHYIKMLEYYFGIYGVGSYYYPNLYISVANFMNMPSFSDNLKTRNEELRIFRGSFENFVTGYDYLLDIDLLNKDDFKETYNEALILFQYFKKYIPFSIRFSGNGFHIIIDNKYFSFLNKNEVIDFQKFFTSSLLYSFKKQKIDLKCVDWKIISKRRMYKLPYSLDIKSNHICYPLTEDEFLNFDYNLVTYPFKENIKNRGVPIINSINSNPENFFKSFYNKNTKKFEKFLNEIRNLNSSFQDLNNKKKVVKNE
jgi:hypothetical protein